MSASIRRWTLAATIVGSSMTFVDATAVNVALPALQRELQATITDVQWVIEAYALFLGSLILIGGSLGDQFGRKRVFLIGVCFFAIASAGCGLSGSTSALIVARALQGFGAALLVPGSLAIISATFPDAERGRAIGTWSGFSAIMSAIGPVAGGWLIEHVSWRAVFFLNIPLAVLVVVLSVRFMQESRDPSRASDVDWTGATLAVLGLGAIVFALLEWPRQTAHGDLIAILSGGTVALLLFVLVEHRVGSPMLPLELFGSRAFSLANVLTLFLYGALAVVLWLVPLNLIQVQHYSATAAGGSLLPFPVLLFLLSRWSGGLVRRVGARLPLTIGPLVSAAGLALFARVGSNAAYWTEVFPAVVVLGLGMAIVIAPLTTTVMSAVAVEHAGVASGVNNAVARVAGLVAIAVFGIVLVRSFDSRMAAALDSMALPQSARASVEQELPKLAGIDVSAAVAPDQRPKVQTAIDTSFVSSFQLVMMIASAVALTAAASGLAIR